MNLIIDNDCENRKQKLTNARPEDFLSPARSSDSSLKVENYAFRGKFRERMRKLQKQKFRASRAERIQAKKSGVSFSLDKDIQSPISYNSADANLADNVNDLGLETNVLVRHVAQQLKRAARLEKRLEHKAELVKILHKLGFHVEAESLKKCNATVWSLFCGKGHFYKKVVEHRCHLPICADCCETKSLGDLGRVLPKFLQALKDNPSLILAFMTLTLRSDKKRGLRGGCKQLKRSFAKLRDRAVWKNCIGGYGRIENTFNRMLGWHPHIHCLLLLEKYLVQKDLSNKWQAITKDSMIVDIRQVYDVAEGLVECIKYPFKLSDVRSFGREQFKEIFALKGERLGVSFGEIYGLETDFDIDETLENDYSDFVSETKNLEAGDACPHCQERLEWGKFSAAEYAKVLACIPIESHTRGKPR